jgi:hypothetical protein
MTKLTGWKLGVVMLAVGLVGGIGLGIWGTMGCAPKHVPETRIIEKTIEVEKQLSDIHVLKEICSEAFITARGNGLCRLLWCRAHTRNAIGTAQSATSKECESVSNLMNKQSLIQTCQDFAKEDADTKEDRAKRFDQCVTIFDRRI